MEKERNGKSAKFWDDVKGGFEKGYAASKEGLKKAGAAIQKFSDKSVVAVEKKQFETKRKKSYAQIGEIVAKKLSSNKPISSKTLLRYRLAPPQAEKMRRGFVYRRQ